jgi:hypothetical protein
MDARALNDSGVEFVLTDLDVALTFMDVADVSRIAETKARNHRNAREAYTNVLRLLHNLYPAAAIEEKLALLKMRLIAAGQVV